MKIIITMGLFSLITALPYTDEIESESMDSWISSLSTISSMSSPTSRSPALMTESGRARVEALPFNPKFGTELPSWVERECCFCKDWEAPSVSSMETPPSPGESISTPSTVSTPSTNSTQSSPSWSTHSACCYCDGTNNEWRINHYISMGGSESITCGTTIALGLLAYFV